MENLVKLTGEETLKFILGNLESKPEEEKIIRLQVFGTNEQASKLAGYLSARLPDEYKVKLLPEIGRDREYPIKIFDIDVYGKSVLEISPEGDIIKGETK